MPRATFVFIRIPSWSIVAPVSENWKKIPPTRVAVGMSGGLDSSAVASMLMEQGHEVIGLTLRMFQDGSRCCSIEDIERAQRVCGHLGIRHYAMNVIDRFEELVIARFVEDYAKGRTPSPCVLCNEFIKFGDLQRRALQLGCTHIATGHYVRVEEDHGFWRLRKGRDAKKDQSYFLHRLSQEQLSRCIFPLESMNKPEVAAYAEERKLPVMTSSKMESQDLCFVTDDGHAAFVGARHPELEQAGEIVDIDGNFLGKHPGIHHFTVGQRRGLGVAAGDRLYVTDLDAGNNRVVAGSRHAAESTTCRVTDIHWVAGTPPETTEDSFPIGVRVRYRTPTAEARVEFENAAEARVYFNEPQFAITPGQAAVFYREDEVLGGGWIEVEKRTIVV